jgi:oligoribonuclease (3'-5' exoribonuclease)
MVDCEMTGVIPTKDKLLQVAAIKLKRDGYQYKQEGEPFVRYLSYDGKPETAFHKQYLTHIFKKCNESSLETDQLKEELHEWLGSYLGKATPVGDCVPTDIEFLRNNDCIDTQHYVNDEPVLGTFHYEYFDMNAPKKMARVKMGGKFDTPNLDDNIHDALVDCQNQTKELNHILSILLGFYLRIG